MTPVARTTPGGEKQRPIVAELGRPETPDEEAARKAQNSLNYRESKTLRNLLIALALSLGLVAAMVFLVPRSETSLLEPVDYVAVAADAQRSMPVELAVPALPEGWSSNSAELRRTSDGVNSWYIGLVSPSNDYVGLSQGVDANATWLAQQVSEGFASGVVDIGGVEWTVYDNRQTSAEVGNARYALTAEAGRSTYVVFGTADPAEIEAVAEAIAPTVAAGEETAP